MKHRLCTVGVAAILAVSASGSAFAADLGRGPPPAPVPPPVPVLTWTGFYFGADVGGTWAHNDFTAVGASSPNTFSVSPSGVSGGGFVGYNAQLGTLVIGAEGEFFGTSLKGSTTNTIGSSLTEDTDSATYGARIRGRIGYAFDNLLLFAAGGWTTENYKVRLVSVSSPDETSLSTATRDGFNVGAGIDWAITSNWVARVEYIYDRLDSQTFGTSTNPYFVDRALGALDQHTVRVGLSYKFGAPPPPPVAARY